MGHSRERTFSLDHRLYALGSRYRLNRLPGMSLVAQKYLVGIMGLILVGSVIATGYLDSRRRIKGNASGALETSVPAAPLSPQL
jgi:hypothetical protein